MQKTLLWVVSASMAAGLMVTSAALVHGQQISQQVQDPKYACTIKVPENTPTAQLGALAKITVAQAEAAAKTSVPGTVQSIRLEDENGCLVYSVHIAANGKFTDVKVDAGNSKVVHQEAGGEGEEEGDEN